jgi:hypothetical protein
MTGVRPGTPSLWEAWAYLLGRQGLLEEVASKEQGSPAPTAWTDAVRWWSEQPAYVVAAARE